MNPRRSTAVCKIIGRTGEDLPAAPRLAPKVGTALRAVRDFLPGCPPKARPGSNEESDGSEQPSLLGDDLRRGGQTLARALNHFATGCNEELAGIKWVTGSDSEVVRSR